MNREQTLAVVTNNKDPAKGGAIKVALASMGSEEYPEWVEPIHPAGVFFHPEPGDTVHMDIPEGADITEFSEEVRYHGKVTSETEAYPDEFQTNYPDRRGFQTKKGHTLILDDKTGDWLIKTAETGHEIKLEGEGTVTIKNGKTGDTVVMGSGGVCVTSATTKLGGAAAVDALVKGTTFKASFAAMVAASNPAETMALVNAILTALKATALSTKVTTE
jgi:hypothetical protein